MISKFGIYRGNHLQTLLPRKLTKQYQASVTMKSGLKKETSHFTLYLA